MFLKVPWDETGQKQESGDSTPTPASCIEVPYQEDPHGLPPRIKKEEESSDEDTEAPQCDQPQEHGPYVPESGLPHLDVRSVHDQEATLIAARRLSRRTS